MRTRWLTAAAAAAIAAATLSAPRSNPARGQTAATTTAAAAATTTTGPATTRAAARPSAEVVDLIRKLGSDAEADRDAAQRKLVDRSDGDPAVEDAVRTASSADPDPEVRGRAAATLALIHDHAANDATPITLHLTNASPNEVLAQLGAQAHAQVTGIIPGVPVAVLGGAAGRSITINVDRQPFWVVTADVCKQLGLCPQLDMPARNQIRLFPTPGPRNWITSSPHQVVGPFWVSAFGLYRSRSINLAGDHPTTDDQFYVRLVVYGEPKLLVTQMSGFNVREATDDAGNDLVLPANPAAANPVAAARALVLLRTRQTDPRTAEARLAYPAEHPGKRIAVLRGDVSVTLAQGVQRFEATDVLAPAPTVTQPLPGAKVRLSLTKQGAGVNYSYSVTVQVTRDGMSDTQWYAMGNRLYDIVLEDADGHPLTSYMWSVDSSDGGEQTLRATALFTRTGFATMPLGGRPAAGPLVPPPAQTGEPARFVWNVASRFKTVVVPVTFNDLPMP